MKPKLTVACTQSSSTGSVALYATPAGVAPRTPSCTRVMARISCLEVSAGA